MASMYDTIMELPLFKGIGEEQLSTMLEKTRIEFIKYEEGDIISHQNSKVIGIDFILSGKVRQIHHFENFSLDVIEVIREGEMLGALNMYGLRTTYPATSVAMEKLSLMRIAKSQYMNVLLSDKIYILNFVNFLSAAAQKSTSTFMHGNDCIMRSLFGLAFSTVSKNAETIILAGQDKDFADFCGCSVEKFREWKKRESNLNQLRVKPGEIIIKSPKFEE